MAKPGHSWRNDPISLALGAACGFFNGCIVVYGRIQPIIATLATGAIFIGLALFIRPTPGGDVDPDLNHSIHAHGLAGRECGVHRQAPLAVASGSTDVQVAMTVDHRAG